MTTMIREAAAAALLTERLRLRPHEAGDAAAIATLARYDAPPGSSANVDTADARAWIALARLTPGAETFAICDAALGAFVGAIGVVPADADAGAGEVSLWIGETYRRRGYGREALAAFAAHCFTAGGLETLILPVGARNAVARSLAEGCGFRYLEDGSTRSVALRGRVPVQRYALNRTDWQAETRQGASERRPPPADRVA